MNNKNTAAFAIRASIPFESRAGFLPIHWSTNRKGKEVFDGGPGYMTQFGHSDAQEQSCIKYFTFCELEFRG